jgi:hypothetical protein
MIGPAATTVPIEQRRICRPAAFAHPKPLKRRNFPRPAPVSRRLPRLMPAVWIIHSCGGSNGNHAGFAPFCDEARDGVIEH